MKKIDNIIDNIHGNICISKIEKKIISTKTFNRLHDISQGSVTYLTFPSNRTKRFEHSIGTMHLAGTMFRYSISNSEDDVLEAFFERTDLELKKLCGEKYNGKVNDDVIRNGFYVESIPNHSVIKNKYLKKEYLLIFQAIRLAGLLHDLGHPPYSHIVEDVLSKEFAYNLDNENTINKQFLDVMKNIYGILDLEPEELDLKNRVLHEKLGNEISKKLIQYIENTNTNFGKNLSTITYNILTNDKNDFFRSLHLLVSSDVDADRLDYINRDSLNSGLSVGKLEYNRLLSNMKLVKQEVTNEDEEVVELFHFAYNIKTIDVIDRFLQNRSRIYTEMNYHHRNIKMSYLLTSTIESLMRNYFFDKNSYNSKIYKLWAPLKEISELLNDVSPNDNIEDSVESFVQWKDSWLVTELMELFLSKDFNNIESDIFKCNLVELLTNKKNLISVIKNRSNFNTLDKKLVSKIKDKLDDNKLSQYIKDCNYALYKLDGSEKGVRDSTFIVQFEDFIHKLYRYDKSIDGFFFRSFEMYDQVVSSPKEKDKSTINVLFNDIKGKLKYKYKDNVVIVHNAFKDHKGEEVPLYANGDGDIYWCNDFSGFNQENKYSYLYVPSVFIYITKNIYTSEVENNVLDLIATIFADKIVKDIKETYEKFVKNIIC
ncbi:MAG: hypothetical protein WC154_00260 [Candidatus Izemoplasmatales bacterium]